MIFDICEPFRKVKRGLDGYISSRKAFVLVLVGMALLLYSGPSVFRWLIAKSPKMLGANGECLAAHMYKFSSDIGQFDASISKNNGDNAKGYLFYVGNGKIGLSIDDNKMYIYNKRSLSLFVEYHPVVLVDVPGASSQEGTIIHFTSGIAYKYQCFSVGRVSLSVTHRFLASRTVPSLLIQHIEIINPSTKDVAVRLKKPAVANLKSQNVQVKQNFDTDILQYKLHSGLVDAVGNSDVIFFSVISPEVPDSITVDSKSSRTITIQTIVRYSDPSPQPPFDVTVRKVKEIAQQDLQRALSSAVSDLIQKHTSIWKQIWHSGFGISLSKAQGALNGDAINATLYYIMSNTREYMYEWDATPQYQQVLQKYLYTPDKCYGGHHTLQASKLWSSLKTIRHVNDVVSLWFLTLIKQGCQNLMKAGACGVMQAMILSFGGFKFSNHHLEFDCEPKDLHRDYYFRRIIYGNSTHINISVILQEDNKAIIYSALDRSDRDYYACDAGCLDTPIKLSSKPAQFPVKITNPLTAILYVTSDKQHMEELKHTIHVKEVIEAPAHEHHVIALHRHGHKLGGLPVFFWVSIAFLIAVFHLFLIKLIYNEYCGSADKSRKRYNV